MTGNRKVTSSPFFPLFPGLGACWPDYYIGLVVVLHLKGVYLLRRNRMFAPN